MNQTAFKPELSSEYTKMFVQPQAPFSVKQNGQWITLHQELDYCMVGGDCH